MFNEHIYTEELDGDSSENLGFFDQSHEFPNDLLLEESLFFTPSGPGDLLEECPALQDSENLIPDNNITPKSDTPHFSPLLSNTPQSASETTNGKSEEASRGKLGKNCIKQNQGGDKEKQVEERKECAKVMIAEAEKGKPGRRRKFTREEDQQLLNLVKKYGEAQWAVIAKQVPGRDRKQLRDHYVNILKRESCSKDFTPEEDSTILRLVKTEGRAWNNIAIHLPDRSAAAIKNRFYSRLKKLLKLPRSRSHSLNCSGEDARKSWTSTPPVDSSFVSDSTEGGACKKCGENVIVLKIPEKELQRVLELAAKKTQLINAEEWS